jgi:hypothetical protein
MIEVTGNGISFTASNLTRGGSVTLFQPIPLASAAIW